MSSAPLQSKVHLCKKMGDVYLRVVPVGGGGKGGGGREEREGEGGRKGRGGKDAGDTYFPNTNPRCCGYVISITVMHYC